ncbi:MAG: DUF362 domain-containing protein [Deltaproteobacteria bacterium]|nr:DUF362 domain-containing protein [Deltaproteobacteria bacterium]
MSDRRDEGLSRRAFVRGVAVTALGTAAGLAGPGCRRARAGKAGTDGAAAEGAAGTAGREAATAGASGAESPDGGTHVAGPAADEAGAPPAGPRARVVLVRDEAAVDEAGRIDAEVVGRMVDDAVCGVVEVDDPVEAWRTLVAPGDVVGIKTNVWDSLPTPAAVESRLRERILGAGVPESSLFLDDRGALETMSACTALVNARPARSHHWAGMGGCIKNYVPFVEEPSAFHPDSCADLGAIWTLPIVRDKTRLNLLVVLTPLFYGRGPHHFDRRFVWAYKGILASRDPVAVDAVGAELLRRKRMAYFGEDRPMVSTKHIGFAETRHGLGVADLARIDLVRSGWTQEPLV